VILAGAGIVERMIVTVQRGLETVVSLALGGTIGKELGEAGSPPYCSDAVEYDVEQRRSH